MNTHDIRIGNFVLHEGRIIAVKSVFPKGINASMDRATGKISYLPAEVIEPIPLSSDLLRRFGFEQIGIRWLLRGVHNLFVDRAVDRFYISIGALGERVCQIQYVHQLQNLFADGWGIALRLRR